MTEERFTVQHRQEESRYVLVDEQVDDPSQRVVGEEVYVDMTDGQGQQRVLFHTSVSDAYSGQGLASTLVRAVVDDSIARGFAVVPVCSYVASWLPRHPEYDKHVVQPAPEHLRAVADRGR